MMSWTPTAKGWPFALAKDLPKNAGAGRSERQLFWKDTLLENVELARTLEALGRERRVMAEKVAERSCRQAMLDIH